MGNTINYGIDLGTTNSAIAKFTKGEVKVFTNPLDLGRMTLPSVVSFKKDRRWVGNKAKEKLEKNSKDVFSIFKRKMGTSESYQVKCLGQSKTPIELSAEVLKELKTFVTSGDKIESTVITIPASFDTIQSNATKEAGFQAGFKQVVLLQEPIAASLAYANMTKEKELSDGQWLVYDLGGGTFDIALVKISDGEMKVLDHEGNNFLGGADFDQMLVENFIIPHLEKEGNFENLKEEMQSAKGKYNSSYHICLHKAEEAKIELSARTSTEIELILEDDDGEELDTVLTITRSEFEDMIKPEIDGTIEMVKKIITRHSLVPEDLQFVLMIGGSTYIPFVRKRVSELVGANVNTDIDPTTAVAVGAAYYAGTKQIDFNTETKQKDNTRLNVKMAYQKATKEVEEFFAARFFGDTEGLFYRIDREDGGFSTGMKPLEKQIGEELPLVESAYNFFILTVYDNENNIVKTDAETIGINSGYAVSGQPLPFDISLEVDDYDNPGRTKSELLFPKNTILPIKKTITRTLNRTIIKGAEDSIIINVLEGSHLALPLANLSIGFMEINGKSIARDVSKGSDIEITLEMSESRDLTASAYLTMLDQEFKEVFNPKERHTSVEWLTTQVEELADELESEINQAVSIEDFETAETLQKLQKEMDEVVESSNALVNDDVTDKRYQLEDKKRKIAQEIDNATKDKRIQQAKNTYFETKKKCIELINDYGNDYERKALNDVISQENSFLDSNNPMKTQEKSDELHSITVQVLWRKPEFLVAIFKDLVSDRSSRMNNQDQVKTFIDAGKFSIQSENWERLAEVNHGLMNLLPKGAEAEIINKIGF